MVTSFLWASAPPSSCKWVSQQVTRRSTALRARILPPKTDSRLDRFCCTAIRIPRLCQKRRHNTPKQRANAFPLIANAKPAFFPRNKYHIEEWRHLSSCVSPHTHAAPGSVRMVDVSEKHDSLRVAVAEAKVFVSTTICEKWKVYTRVPPEKQPFQASSAVSAGSEGLEPLKNRFSNGGTNKAATLRSPKGDIFEVAKVAGIMAAKQTSSLIPLCHNLPLLAVEMSLTLVERESATAQTTTTGEKEDASESVIDHEENSKGATDKLRSGRVCQRPYVLIRSLVKTHSATGVEMEALTAVAAAGLTIYDMCKSLDTNIIISDMRLLAKEGGKSDFAAVP